MRLIGHLENEQDAERFTSFLKRKGIATSCDGSFDAKTGNMSYQIWGIDEDRFEEAKVEFSKFKKQPENASYDTPITEQMAPVDEKVMEKEEITQKSTPLTVFIIALCFFIFALNYFQEQTIPETALTPVQSALLFDLPADSPWTGIYDWVVGKITGKKLTMSGPLFEKIREGEVWRLFSPAILHVEFLHILFNMIWVWVLSRVVERKIGFLRLLLLSLIIGIISNIAQYLMSGPLFIGYSGVVMGLAGFTWMREKVAPWEGYPLARSTILFLLVYIGGILLVQTVAFFLQIFTTIQFAPAIANTAHIVGGLLGALLGRFSFFAERVRQ